MTTKHHDAVAAAKNLDELLIALQYAELDLVTLRHDNPDHDFGQGIEQEFGIDLADLPTFGGEWPADTTGIYSWDETRLLAADGSHWTIEPREDS